MSLYQMLVWQVKGLKAFTNTGFEAAAKNFNQDDLKVDVTGRHFMITGSNSGIGKATAIEIAKCGGTVHMVCRNQERADEAREEIISKSGNQNVDVYVLDLEQPREIWKFVASYAASGKPLDVLVNNGSCMVMEKKTNADRLEINFLTNTLGTYILTVGLLPLLQKSSNPRVVTVSSGGILMQRLNIYDLQFERMRPYKGFFAYAQTKRQQIVIMEELAKKYTDVHFSCMHPGWVDTAVVRTSVPDFYEKNKTRLRTAEQGADTVVWLCLAPGVTQIKSAEFFQDRVVVSKHLPLACTKSPLADQEKLMTCLEELADKYKDPAVPK